MRLMLDGVAATGASSSYDQNGRSFKDHTIEVRITDADTSITACTVALEGSLDDSNWYTLASHALTAAELTALAAMFHVADKAVRYARVNITTLTGAGAADKVYVYYEPYERY